jgi:hypothetical protein
MFKELTGVQAAAVDKMTKQVVMSNELQRAYCGAEASVEQCLSGDDLRRVFGHIDAIVPAHQALLAQLTAVLAPALDFYAENIESLPDDGEPHIVGSVLHCWHARSLARSLALTHIHARVHATR